MVLLLIWPAWHKTAGWDVPFLELAMTIKRSLDTHRPFLFSLSPITFKTVLNCNFKMLFCLLFGFQWEAFDKWHILWVLPLLGASCSWRLLYYYTIFKEGSTPLVWNDCRFSNLLYPRSTKGRGKMSRLIFMSLKKIASISAGSFFVCVATPVYITGIHLLIRLTLVPTCLFSLLGTILAV